MLARRTAALGQWFGSEAGVAVGTSINHTPIQQREDICMTQVLRVNSDWGPSLDLIKKTPLEKDTAEAAFAAPGPSYPATFSLVLRLINDCFSTYKCRLVERHSVFPESEA
jgi:hypothetical protein